MGFFEVAGAFLDGFFGEDSQESLGDWIDRYSDSRRAAGVYLYLHHKQSSGLCDIEGVIVNYHENEIDRYLATGISYDSAIKDFFEGGQIVGKSGNKVKEIWIPFDRANPKKTDDYDDFDDEDDDEEDTGFDVDEEDDEEEDDYEDDYDDFDEDDFDDDYDDDDVDFDDESGVYNNGFDDDDD